jgi:prepilin-type N-terminal cleavage/methylation domain-containing protein
MQALTNTHHPLNKQQRGFTIVELLGVIVVIGILAAITIVGGHPSG